MGLTLSLLLSFAAASPAGTTTWYCDAGAPGPGDGSVGSPFSSLQAGIDAASGGDTVLAAAGTYFEHLDFLGKAITVRGAGPDSTRVDGSFAGPVVRFASGEGSGSRLEDLRLQNGLGELVGGGAQPIGGGLLVLGTSPVVSGCVVSFNGVTSATAIPTLYGGGAYIEDGSPQFLDTDFIGNRSCSGGGGVAIFGDAAPTFTGCSFSGNVTNSFPGLVAGGGVLAEITTQALPLFTACSFQNNLSDRGGALAGRAHVVDSTFTANQSSLGGAVYLVTLAEGCLFSSNSAECYFGESGLGGGAAYGSTLRDCVVQGNRATIGGGVLACSVEDSTISGNHAMYQGNCNGVALGGGAKDSVLLRCILASNDVEEGFGPPDAGVGGGLDGGLAEDCLIVGNFADQGGGASNAILERCTLVENDVRLDAGGGYLVTARNCIFSGNLGGQLDAASSVVWSLVEGGFVGTGNRDGDPRFESGASGTDYDLGAGSAAIDAGDPLRGPDLDDSLPDLGPFPRDQSASGSPGSYCDAKVSSGGCAGFVMWTGEASLTAPSLRVVAAGVDAGRSGLLFFGTAQAAIPFLGGTLCIRPPLARTPLQSSGGVDVCTGVFDHAFRVSDWARFASGATDNLYAQYWYRDPGASDGSGAGLTNAMQFTLTP